MIEPKQRTQAKSVLVSSEVCSGCRCCQLACSFVKTGAFSLAYARVKLHRVDGKERYAISFASDCDACGYCARYCFYGVLKASGK